MSMVKRAWFVASVIVALAALVAGSLGPIGSSVTSPAGALGIAVGLMPAALQLAGSPSRRRMIGVFHIAAGTTLAIAGFVLASQDNFLRLTMASIDFRALATSGSNLAPLGLMAIGVALMLTGTGLLLSRRSFAVLSALLVILTSGFFAVSLALAPYLRLRHLGHALFDQQAVAAAAVLLMVALLLVFAALSRYPVTWMPLIPARPGNPPRLAGDSPRPHEIIENQGRRWMKPAIWSAVSLATVTGISIWAWLTWGPRFVLADVFPDPNLAGCVADEMGQHGSSTKGVTERAGPRTVPVLQRRPRRDVYDLHGAFNPAAR
jgi:hypothetical protein